MTLGRPKKLGLVLSGGGARGAYQAGVLSGIAEIAAAKRKSNPFQVVTGVSAGAVNAAGLVAWPGDFIEATDQLVKNWTTITASDVFKTDAVTAGRLGFKFLIDTALGSMKEKKMARSLLDTAPLREYLAERIPFEKLESRFREDGVQSLALTAMNYTNAHSITFVQGLHKTLMWDRSRRKSVQARIGVEHVMASSAIPIFFPPVSVGDDFYGDGCLRNTAPLSPAIHLGSDRILVIGVRRPDHLAKPPPSDVSPSLARVTGVILNALLMDAVEFDMERLGRINQTVDMIPAGVRSGLELRKIEYLWIRPSQDIGSIAAGLYERLPSVIRYLVAGLGSQKESSELTSYLLFDPEFCGELVRLGRQDALASKDDITKFLD
jgi:NTE family protein